MSYTLMVVLVNVLFVAVILAGFFVGFWRGLKKSAVSAAFAVTGAIVAFFTTPAISNAILSIKVSGGQSLKAFLLGQIVTGDIKTLVEKVPSLSSLVNGLPQAILNVVVFVLVAILMEAILYCIYKIIALIFLRNKNAEEGEEKPKKYRVWGGVIGGVKTLLLSIFVLAPLTSLCGMFGTLTESQSFLQTQAAVETSSQTQEKSNILDNLPAPLIYSTKALENSGFGFFGGLFGFNDATFDYLSSVKVDGQNVSIRNEIVSIWPAYQLYQDVSTVMSEDSAYTFADLDFDKVEITVDDILQSGIYKTIVVDMAKDVFENPKNYDFIPDGVVANILTEFYDQAGQENLGNYLASDVKTVVKIVREMSEDEVLQKVQDIFQDVKTKLDELQKESDEKQKQAKINEIMDTLTNAENFDTIKKVIGDLFSMNIVKGGIKPVVQVLSDNVLGNITLTPTLPTIEDENWSNIANDLAGILQSASKVLSQLDINDITGDKLQTWIDDLLIGEEGLDSIFTDLGELLDKLDASPLFKTADGSIVDSLLGESITFPEAYKDIDGNPVTIDSYTKLFKDVFLPSLNSLRQSGLYKKLKEDISLAERFGFIADQIENDEKFLQKIILPLIQVQPTDQIVKDLLKDNDQIKFSVLDTYDKWENDLTQISTVLKNLKNVGIDKDGEPSTTVKQGIEYLFSSNFDHNKFIIALTPEQGTSQVENILAPLFKAYSTQELAQTVFTNISTALNGLLQLSEKDEINLQADISLFIGKDDQSSEVCAIIEKFMPLFKAYQAEKNTKLEMLYLSQKDAIDKLLEVLNTNASRNLEDKNKKAGMFAKVYVEINNKIEQIKSSLPH